MVLEYEHDSLSIGLSMESLQKLVCSSCGAALPADQHPARIVRCAHCGTLYVPPGNGQGGIYLSGTVTVKGDLVGGDKVVVVQRSRSLLERILAVLQPKR
jgi:hypothetical protein